MCKALSDDARHSAWLSAVADATAAPTNPRRFGSVYQPGPGDR